jgi:hypothetical protein
MAQSQSSMKARIASAGTLTSSGVFDGHAREANHIQTATNAVNSISALKLN